MTLPQDDQSTEMILEQQSKIPPISYEATSAQNKANQESAARNLEALNAALPAFEMIMPDGRRLKKADKSTLRDAKFVDEDGHAVMTEKYLKQICREQKAYTTPSLNDKVYFHYKGRLAINFTCAFNN